MRCNSSPILTQRQPFDIRDKEAEHNKSNSPRRQLSTAQQLLKARKESITMVGATSHNQFTVQKHLYIMFGAHLIII